MLFLVRLRVAFAHNQCVTQYHNWHQEKKDPNSSFLLSFE